MNLCNTLLVVAGHPIACCSCGTAVCACVCTYIPPQTRTALKVGVKIKATRQRHRENNPQLRLVIVTTVCRPGQSDQSATFPCEHGTPGTRNSNRPSRPSHQDFFLSILCGSPGGSGGAAGRGPVLHDLRAGNLGGRGVADERVADAGAQAVRGRDLLPGDEVHQHTKDPS